MAVIRLLPADVANQIAAGEVVERPASVVKEVVENALDAGATTVSVSVDGGGLARIAVTDDGSGMSPEDLSLSVVRHATSKISVAADLVGVASYGFRGEALASIASVSRLRITSRARGADEGSEALVEGGAEAVLRPAGCATGTTVSIEDIFYNTPARRKFMRTPQTEGAACVEAVVRLAIARHDVRFVVRRDGKVVREFLRHTDVGARVREVWPDESLAELRGVKGAVRVTAFLGPPEKARSGANHLALYVNGRYVKDRLLMRAVAQAYGSTLEPGRYPVGVVLVEVPSDTVDVNVHPQKAEVRFASQGSVFEAVMTVLRDAASEAPWAQAVARPRDFWAEHLPLGPKLDAERADPLQTAPTPTVVAQTQITEGISQRLATPSVSPDRNPDGDIWARLLSSQHSVRSYAGAGEVSGDEPIALPREAQRRDSTPEAASAKTFGGLRYVGQVRRMYLICEGIDGVVILDQHAAAERVTFEKLRRAYANKSVAMQPLLVPERVELSAEEVVLVEERTAALSSVGVELAAIGPTTVVVRGVPAILSKADPRRLARDVVGELSRQGDDFSRAVDLVLATMACHGSVRGGDELSDTEAKALLAALDTVEYAGHCPHGRPVVFSLRWSELERKVGR